MRYVLQVELAHPHCAFQKILGMGGDGLFSEQEAVLELRDGFDFGLGGVGELKDFLDALSEGMGTRVMSLSRLRETRNRTWGDGRYLKQLMDW